VIPFSLTVEQLRDRLTADQLAKYGWADRMEIDAKVQRYAEDRQKHKQQLRRGTGPDDPADELAYQEGVLDRMKADGCKPCEIKAQARHVERLREQLSHPPAPKMDAAGP